MIAGKERIAFPPGEGEMVCRVPGCLDHCQGPVRSCDGHPVGQPAVGSKTGVGTRPDRSTRGGMGQNRRPNRCGEPACAGTVIAMRMRHDNRGNTCPADRREKTRVMLVIIRARVDHRERGLAEQVGLRAGEGHRSGIGRGHDAQTGTKDLRHSWASGR